MLSHSHTFTHGLKHTYMLLGALTGARSEIHLPLPSFIHLSIYCCPLPCRVHRWPNTYNHTPSTPETPRVPTVQWTLKLKDHLTHYIHTWANYQLARCCVEQHLFHPTAYRRMCLNISLLLGDVKILEYIQLALSTSRENIDFMQID